MGLLQKSTARSGPLDRVYLNDYFGAEETPAKPMGKLMGMPVEGGVRIVRLRAGETIRLDERTTVEVVCPPSENALTCPSTTRRWFCGSRATACGCW